MNQRRWPWVLLGAGITAFVALVGIFGLFVVAGVAGFFDEDPFQVEVIKQGSSQEAVAVIPVAGTIFSDPEGIFPGASDYNILAALRQAEDDPDVVAVILHIDSPGGPVVATDSIYNKILELKSSIPVVALLGDVAASGGYYLAAGANEIVANPSTVTGSIGVIAFFPNLEGAAQKLGVKPIVITSGDLKDIGSPFREMTPTEKQILAGIVDVAYSQFVDVVSLGRGLPESETRTLADGRVFSGRKASEAGLVDHLGGIDLAFERASELSGASDATLLRYLPNFGPLEGILGYNSVSPASLLKETIGVDLAPGLKYLWLP